MTYSGNYTSFDFNPRSPHGERHSGQTSTFKARRISIHAPRTGSDGVPERHRATEHDFNPRSPHGERLTPRTRPSRNAGFQSTLPARGATKGGEGRGKACKFQSTLPARGATRRIMPGGGAIFISIHAPRTGSDFSVLAGILVYLLFQSTLPARGATWPSDAPCQSPTHFNPRSPHGERLRRASALRRTPHFNPRSPHGERLYALDSMSSNSIFQSTLPARGATSCRCCFARAHRISIHAPRTGSDKRQREYYWKNKEFQSTLPARGATKSARFCRANVVGFQSTLPARGATDARKERKNSPTFQSTLPARGATRVTAAPYRRPRHFNPRSPHGERRAVRMFSSCCAAYFNPRSPHGERRGVSIGNLAMQLISIHAPRTGSDALLWGAGAARPHFNPRSPHGERRLARLECSRYARISIHAPRTGSDRYRAGRYNPEGGISIHAPRTGSDNSLMAAYDEKDKFQSTLPARGATVSVNSL